MSQMNVKVTKVEIYIYIFCDFSQRCTLHHYINFYLIRNHTRVKLLTPCGIDTTPLVTLGVSVRNPM